MINTKYKIVCERNGIKLPLFEEVKWKQIPLSLSNSRPGGGVTGVHYSLNVCVELRKRLCDLLDIRYRGCCKSMGGLSIWQNVAKWIDWIYKRIDEWCCVQYKVFPKLDSIVYKMSEASPQDASRKCVDQMPRPFSLRSSLTCMIPQPVHDACLNVLPATSLVNDRNWK